MIIRDITGKDIKRVLAIYSPYILNTTVTFEYDIPNLINFEERVNHVTSNFPWLVCEVEGQVAGYAYASYYRERTAFSWDCELSVYLDDTYGNKGIGQSLYERLIKIVTLQGYYNAYALIAFPNEKSERLHKKLGFKYEGYLKDVGYKFDKWIDLGQYVKRLQTLDHPGTFPVPYHSLDRQLVDEILK